MKTIKNLMDLKNRIALIAGGGGFIGTAFGETLAELGATVIIMDVDPDKTERAADQIRGHFPDTALRTMTADLGNHRSIENAINDISGEFKQLDIVVNCAAFYPPADTDGWCCGFDQQTPEIWRQCIDLNLTSAMTLAQACTPLVRFSGRGSIVNVSSIYGMVGPDLRLYEDTAMGNSAAYAASKGGIIQITRYLATVLAPDIRVNTISPGGVWRGQAEVFTDRYNQKTPLRRMAVEEDLKGAIAFLASDMSAYVTGHNLVVDGGFSIW
jgi:NAD(P)-dependent dehydrogenase (short-subunit alcohol dehydrogenase family)